MSASEPARSEVSPAGGAALSRARVLFLAIAGLTAVASVWMLGSEPLAAQRWLLGGAVATLVMGVWVRICAGRRAASWRTMEAEWWLLVLGLLFLGLLWSQAANPSLRVVLEGKLWRLEPIPTASWRPHSLAAPFDFVPGDFLPYKNAWRFLLIFGAVWVYAAGLVLGCVERSDAKRWMIAVGLNGALLALVCIVHRATGEKLTLWHFQSTFDFTGSPVFFYKNHNGAYLAATMAVVLGLAASAERRLTRHVWEIVALLSWIATVAVNSRVATGCATFFGLLYAAHVWRSWTRAKVKIFTWRRAAMAMVMSGGAAALLVASGAVATLQRFEEAAETPADFLQGGNFRVMLREVGYEMWSDSPVWGWGGGSFLYLYNTYHVRVPALAAHIYAEQPLLNRFFGPTVNCDWVEFLVEYGAVGFLLMLAMMAVFLVAWWRRGGGQEALTFFLLAGVAGLALHAFFDYILRNPALLILATGVIFSSLRYLSCGRAVTAAGALARKQKGQPESGWPES